MGEQWRTVNGQQSLDRFHFRPANVADEQIKPDAALHGCSLVRNPRLGPPHVGILAQHPFMIQADLVC